MEEWSPTPALMDLPQSERTSAHTLFQAALLLGSDVLTRRLQPPEGRFRFFRSVGDLRALRRTEALPY